MRVTSRPLAGLIGLAALACHAAWQVNSAFAQPAAAATRSAATAPRWTAGTPAALSSASMISDAAVAQVAWQSPNGPRNSRINSPSRPAGANSRETLAGSATAAQGFPWKLPSTPFSRANRPTSGPARGAGAPAGRPRTPFGGGTTHSPNDHQVAHRPIGMSHSAQASTATPAAGNFQAAGSMAVSSSATGDPSPRSSPTLQGPILRPAAVTPATAELTQADETPESAAGRLMLAAHEAAATAESETEFGQVIEMCRRARASQPTPAAAQYANELMAWSVNRRGQIKAETGRVSEAILDFEDAIRLDAQCWRAVHNRGVLFAQSGQFEDAFEDFNHTIEINPEFAKAYSNRAALFVVAGDIRPALDDYARAIEIDPNLSVAHRGRGRACHLLGQFDEASEHYTAAVQLSPNDAYAIASRADLLTDMGRYEEAVREYERAIELDPRSAYAYRGAAWLLATCPDDTVRDPALAVRLAETALQLDGKEDSIAFDTLAAAQASNGDFRAAVETLNRAIALAPESEIDVYQDRLLMYHDEQPFRISPMREVEHASYESSGGER